MLLSSKLLYNNYYVALLHGISIQFNIGLCQLGWNCEKRFSTDDVIDFNFHLCEN